jgi:AraC family transcriptional regulator
MKKRLVRSVDARRHLKATMTACSSQAGWRSLLLRAYVDPPVVEELTVPPAADQLIVLVTRGATEIEGRHAEGWCRAQYRPGSVGMTAPGQECQLRWQGDTSHSTLQLHLPEATTRSIWRDLSNGDAPLPELPNSLHSKDPFLERIMLGLAEAMASGAPDLYAETAGDLIAVHLLVRYCRYQEPSTPLRDDQRLRRVEDLMRANLHKALSLETMAKEACMSRFHFLRMFKATYGETPFKHLTRLRMEEAQRRRPYSKLHLRAVMKTRRTSHQPFVGRLGLHPMPTGRPFGKRLRHDRERNIRNFLSNFANAPFLRAALKFRRRRVASRGQCLPAIH